MSRDLSQGHSVPCNIEAEQAILGGLLMDNLALDECLAILAEDDFYSPAHRLIFRAICEAANLGKPFDCLAIKERLASKNELDKIGGPAYLVELLDNIGSAANIGYYCRIVNEKAVLRAIITAAAKMTELAYAPIGEEPPAILDSAQRDLMNITTDRGGRNTLKNAQDICKATFKMIEDRHNCGDTLTGLSTGFRDLDNWTAGLQSSELIIIAGRPGMGKTALALNIVEHVIKNEIPAALFSLEMGDKGLMIRLLASLTGIDSRRLQRGKIANSEWPKLVSAVCLVSNTPLYIDDSGTMTPLELRAKARRLKIDRGLGLIVVDYIQLMTVPGKAHQTREREIAEISRSLKALAKELDVPVVALSQLNRQSDNRPSKKPTLSDLRESGAIEQDADVIAFIYRDEFYNKSEDNPEKGFAEIIIGKQRNGPTGAFKMKFNAEQTRFYDVSVGSN